MWYALGVIVLCVTCGAVLILIGGAYLIVRAERTGRDGL